MLAGSLHPEDHTGENLQDALSVTLQEWHIDSQKLLSITTDSASNIKLACEMLGWLCLSCFGHNLDLAINKRLNDHRIDRVLSLCRKVVSAFSYSWKRKRDPKVVQEQKYLPAKMLKGSALTRWGSKCDMIVRILEQQDTIWAVLAQDRKTSHLVPSWQDIDVLQSVVAAIKPFQNITDLLSGEKRVTCSAIKPMIQLIQETMVNHQDDDTSLTCEIKDCINSDLEHRYAGTEVSMLLDKCSFLDPRFKDKYKLTDEPVQVLLQEASMLESESVGRVVSNSQTGQNETESSEPLTKKRKGKFSSIFGKTATFPTSLHSFTVSERIQCEAEMYLQYPILNIDESQQRWSLEASRMPLLYSAAHEYLSVCAKVCRLKEYLVLVAM